MARQVDVGFGTLESPGAAEARADPQGVECRPLAATIADGPSPARVETQGLPTELVPDGPRRDLDPTQHGTGRGRQCRPDAIEQHDDLGPRRRVDAPDLRGLGQDTAQVGGTALEMGRPLGPEAVEAVLAHARLA